MLKKCVVCCKPFRSKTGIIISSSSVTLFVIVLLALPYFIRSVIVDMLLERGADQVLISDVDFNPFNGAFVINKLVLVKNKKEELRVEKIIGTISWLKLIKGDIELGELLIENTDVGFSTQGDHLMVAGLTHFKQKTNQDNRASRQWAVAGVFLRNMRINGNLDGFKLPPLRIDALNLGQLDSNVQREPGKLKIHGRYKSNPYLLEAELTLFQSHPQLSLRLQAKDMWLSAFNPFFAKAHLTLDGTTSFDLQLRMRHIKDALWQVATKGEVTLNNLLVKDKLFRASNWHLTLKQSMEQILDLNNPLFHPKIQVQISATDPHILLSKNNGLFQFKNLQIQGDLTLTQPQARVTKLFAGSIVADEFTTHDRSSETELMRVTDVNASDVALFSDFSASVKLLTNKTVKFAQSLRPASAWTDQFSERLINTQGIHIKNLLWSPQRGVGAQLVEILSPTIYLVRDTKKWQVLEQAHAAIKNLKPQQLKIRIDKLQLRGPGNIVLRDHSMKEGFKSRIQVSRFEWSNINSLRPDLKSLFSIYAHIDGYTKLVISGYMMPFSKKINLNLNVTLRELVLPKYSSYLQTYYGYQIIGGHLDATLRFTATQSQLSGENYLVFTHLKLRRSETSEQARSGLSFRLPMELFVKLLANSRNEIKFKIPNKGNLDDPKFKWGDEIAKSMQGSVQRGGEIAVRVVSPVGRVFTLFQSANKLFTNSKFQPVIFPETRAELSANFIKNAKPSFLIAAEYLKQKPQANLRVCAYFTQAELTQIVPKKNASRAANTQARKLAIRLGQKRADYVKAILIKEYAIKSNRLFINEPLLDENGQGARPRVEFKL